MTGDVALKPKKSTVRLTEADDALVRRLAEVIGVSMSDVVRMGLRALAKERGVRV